MACYALVHSRWYSDMKFWIPIPPYSIIQNISFYPQNQTDHVA